MMGGFIKRRKFRPKFRRNLAEFAKFGEFFCEFMNFLEEFSGISRGICGKFCVKFSAKFTEN